MKRCVYCRKRHERNECRRRPYPGRRRPFDRDQYAQAIEKRRERRARERQESLARYRKTKARRAEIREKRRRR
jgi:hypothetical protein